MTETLATPDPSAERSDLLAMLAKHRALFLVTVADLTDEQARRTPTVSALSLGGLVKHVAATQAQWLGFVETGRYGEDVGEIDWSDPDPAAYEAFTAGFRLGPDETLAGALETYAAVAARTEELVGTVDLDRTQPLPPAPWFEPGAAWSNRRVFLHLVAETAQHAGHADILRETIDGQQTMG